MSYTTKSAVSDYELLNYKSVSSKAIGINESDDDELFLKAPAPKALVDTLTTIFSDNNNSLPWSTCTSNNQLDQFESVAVNNKIPVPSSWSPGMNLHSNPALLITPDKSLKSSDSHVAAQTFDHSLPVQNGKKAPEPFPWSPSMRPEKSIFITPEKSGKDLKDNKDCTDNLKGSNLNNTKFSTLVSQETEKSSKEKQTVRFDLPSLSSGEDTFFDENSSLFSPVTIKGKELSPDSLEKDISKPYFPSTSLKPYNAKSYNPQFYSDDSTMDESILGCETSMPQSAQSQTQHSNVSLSTSANLVNKLKELMQDSDLSKMAAYSQHIPTDSQIPIDNFNEIDKTDNSDLERQSGSELKTRKGSKKKTLFIQNSTKPSSSIGILKSSDVYVVKETQNNKSKSFPSQEQRKPVMNTKQKAGPHHLKNSLPVYHPPSMGSCIVKEPHHNIDYQDYSYPFQVGSKETENEIEHTFARPEFNSTLKYRLELDNICDQEIDVVKAVNEKLRLGSDKKTEIQEMAAQLTNCPSDQFADLVDLDPPVDRLCDRILRMRTSKVVKKKKKPSEKASKASSNDPDLMEFYSPELQKEVPGFSLHGITPVTSELLSASTDAAFDVYRHNRVWEGIRDF